MRPSPLLAKMHIAKKQLALDDDTYRAALFMVVGKRSAKEMTDDERERVMKHFVRVGFQDRARGGSWTRTSPAGPMAAKIHALWLSGWNLGVIRDPSAKAMQAFISRQTGIARVQWIKDASDARKVIEALKSWLAREGGVDWKAERDPLRAEWTRASAWLVIEAQWRKLSGSDERGLISSAVAHGPAHVMQWSAADMVAFQKHLGKKLRDTLKQEAA